MDEEAVHGRTRKEPKMSNENTIVKIIKKAERDDSRGEALLRRVLPSVTASQVAQAVWATGDAWAIDYAAEYLVDGDDVRSHLLALLTAEGEASLAGELAELDDGGALVFEVDRDND